MSANDYTEDDQILDKVLPLAKEAIEKSEIYLDAPESKIEELKKSTKLLYDLAYKRRTTKPSKSQVLPELIIDDFDLEQIWQQIESANNEIFGIASMKSISELLQGDSSAPIEKHSDGKEDGDNNDDDDDDEDEDEDEDENNENDPMDCNFENSEDSMSENDDKFSDREDEGDEKGISRPKKRRKVTEVDDKFFKLDELDEYLQKEDRKEMNSDKKEDSSDEESIDLFKDFSDEEDEEKKTKYADFFDAPDSDDQNASKEIESEEEEICNQELADSIKKDSETISVQELDRNKKQVKFNLNNSDESDNSEDGDTFKAQENVNNQPKSSLAIREERLKKKIEELEAKAISEKPWYQKGEVDASNRPQNSAIEEVLDFTSGTRPAPVMTEKTSLNLEDIIIQRIKDKAWDDVEKKFKPVETPLEYKKKLIMNQEKSKESLAQIYENEYIQQREALNKDDKDEQEKEEPQAHVEIKEKIHYLFKKLDALSNYHYTPKPAKPEIKIVSNIPAINMEEVAPIGMSDATLLAPEEIKSKQKGELIGKSERTKTDMKRERRKKKLKQRIRASNESKKATDNVIQKKTVKNKKESKKLTGRNIINVDDSSTKDKKLLKSSTSFFAQLQDEVDSGIKTKTKSTMNSRKRKHAVSAVKLKL